MYFIIKGIWKKVKQTYTECVEVMNEIETIEQIIAPPKYRRCCHSRFELLKAVFICLKNKKKSR